MPNLWPLRASLVRGERVGRHAGLARDLEAPLEGALRVLGRLRHVLVVRVHPELGAGALHDRRGLAVVVGVRVRADHEAHVLHAQAGLVERELELAHRAGLVEAGVHEHDAVARGYRVGVAVRDAGPGQRQAQPPESRQHPVGAGQLASPCARHGSIRTPGFRMPAGSTADFAARSAAAKGSGRWRSYQGLWSRPTAWWCVIVPPAADDRLGRRLLQLLPLLELLARGAPARAR